MALPTVEACQSWEFIKGVAPHFKSSFFATETGPVSSMKERGVGHQE